MKRSWVRELAGEIKFILKCGNARAAREWFFARLQSHQAPVMIKVGNQKLFVRPNTTDLLVIRCCFEFGEFDTLLKLKFKNKVKYILDGGAYIGASSVRLAAMFSDATI